MNNYVDLLITRVYAFCFNAPHNLTQQIELRQVHRPTGPDRNKYPVAAVGLGILT